MQFIVQGIGLVFGNRKFWPYVWRPMLISAAILFAIIGIGYWLVVPTGDRFMAARGLDSWFTGGLLRLGYAVIWWFLAGVVFASLGGLLSSFVWEELSLMVEREVDPNAPSHKLKGQEILADALSRGAFAICIFLGTCACFWFPIGAVVLSAWLCLYDYTASAYIRRQVLFPSQFRKAFGVRGSATFAVSAGILTLVPLLNVIALPGLVAGGTLMLAEHERRTRASQ